MAHRNPGLPLVLLLSVGSALAGITACSSARDATFGEGDGSGAPGTTKDTSPTFGEGDGGKPNGTGPGGSCSPNPASYDIPGNSCDDDGDGKVDNPPSCDDGLSPTDDAEAFAQSLGICTKADAKGYGLVSATFTRGYQSKEAPAQEQHGILTKFGNVIRPREGAALGVLSTGYAREYDGTGKEPFGGVTGNSLFYVPNGKNFGNAKGAVPPGFPKAASGCKQSEAVANVSSLKLEMKAPPNVSGIQFDFNFYSGEWPAYICSPFNDGFIAYLTSEGFNGGKPDNVSFDKDNNPVSVNNGFFDRCTAKVPTGCAPDSKAATSECPGGSDELAGTGFGLQGSWCSPFKPSITAKSTSGGATGWLTSHAPVKAGETFTIEFMIWDTGDAWLDSSVLLDNFTWLQGEVAASTDRPVK